MPYASITRPSLALGLLKATLVAGGIAARVLYPNLWFAEEAGLRLYHLCATQAPKELLLGEWTFAAAAFPEAARDDEEYLRRLAAGHAAIPGYHHVGRPASAATALVADLRRLRQAADSFLDRAAERVLAAGAPVVGCTSTFEQHTASLALLRRVRALDPTVVTVLGGANCEGVMGRATHRAFPWVDYVVAGEADALVVDLLRQIRAHGREVPRERLPEGVYGPAHREEEGGAAPRPVFRDLDALPVPDFGDYFEALSAAPFAAAVHPGLPLETSRGCWWGAIRHCTFCGLNGSSMTFRSKSPARVLAEVRALEERHGIARFETVDNILDMGYFQSLLPVLAAEADAAEANWGSRGRGRRFFYEVKSNLRRSQVATLRRAGIVWLQPGIESLHSAVLERMEKGVQAWQNVQLLRACRDFGVRLSWNFLWGFPGEDDAWYGEMARWLPALVHLQPPSGVVRVRFDRFSPYHQRPERFGLELRPVPAAGHVYPLPPAELADLAYFFAASGRPDPFADAGTDAAGDRPGVRAIRDLVGGWRSAFWSDDPPRLSVADDGEALAVVDTRSGCRRYTLHGLDRRVYLACEEAPLAERLAGALRERWGDCPGGLASAGEVAEAVARLSCRRLILAVDRRLVALGTPPDLPPLPGLEDFPGGRAQEGAWLWV